MVVGQTGEQVDVLVLGGGPGGYSAAIRAAQLGLSVALVERDAVGGVCLHHGCVPSKALVTAARTLARTRAAATMGIDAPDTLDLTRLHEWKRGVVEKLGAGVRGLLQQWGVQVVQGTARFAGERRVAVEGGEGDAGIVSFFEFGAAVVATGSRAAAPAGVLTPEAALDLTELPPRLAVVGADYQAVEIATAWARLGSAVTLLVPTLMLVAELDEPLLSRAVAGGARRLGITLHTEVSITTVEAKRVAYARQGEAASVEADAIVLCDPRTPNTDDLGLARVGLRPEPDGRLTVDHACRTAVHHVYALGDVTAGPMLAHRAIAQGRIAAERIAGRAAAFDPTAIPHAYFTEPEVAAVGLSERSARAAGFEVTTARVPYGALGRALTLSESEGFVQVVAESGSGRILGVQIAGASATELISEATLALEMTATLDDLALTLHPHPTLAEGLVEAADLALGKPRHLRRGGR